MSIGDAEIKTQERVIRFFKDPEILGYQYIGDLSDYQNKNIKEDRLRQYLRLKGYADKLIDAAIMQLQQEAGNLSRGVYDANKTVYSRLKYGIPVSESPEKSPVTVELIDEANPLNNDFAIAEEVTVVEQSEKRPDLVVYLNGIAVAVIELKRSGVSVSEGIRQNLTNQKNSFIQSFFTTIQFCMAGNESEGLRYGTLLTGEKFYMEWKDDGFKEHEEERDPVDVRISKTCEGIEKEGAAEAIENNIRKKVIEKVTVNPRYYAKMSEILDKLIEERKQGVLDYAEMLEKYIKLAKDVDCPEDNDKYPESIRKSKALMAIYDNTGEDEKLAIRIHKAVKKQALFGFRDNQVVIRRIKKALYEILICPLSSRQVKYLKLDVDDACISF